METERTPGGIVIPKPRPAEPKQSRPPLEIQDEDRREEAKRALSKLWDAMELGRGHFGTEANPFRERAVGDAHYQVYRYMGEMLLGDDCPEHEMWC